MVRSNTRGDVGRLLSDRRRLNVAFTRAKVSCGFNTVASTTHTPGPLTLHAELLHVKQRPLLWKRVVNTLYLGSYVSSIFHLFQSSIVVISLMNISS